MSLDTTPDTTVHLFDARGVARRFRHAAVFGALDALGPGEAMRLCNDHNPLPLIAQLRERFGERLAVTYRQTGPDLVVIDFVVAHSSMSARNRHADGGCCGSCG